MSVLIEGLPNGVVLRCLARVPFHLHPNIELVSRTWRAALHSPELFKAQQEVGSTLDVPCVCAFEPENQWQLHDPLCDLWITTPVLEIWQLAHSSAISASGKLFVLGSGSDAVDPTTGDQDGNFATNEIVVAGGFTNNCKSIAQSKIYDPEMDVWVSILGLPYTHNSACVGVVIKGKMRVVHEGLSMVQVLEKPLLGWTVEDHDWLQGPLSAVHGILCVISHGLIYKQEKERRKLVVSSSEFWGKIGYAMTGLGGEIYVGGGVICPDPFNWDIKQTLEVRVLTIGSDRPIWC
ncbi:hypothetical protein Ancab_020041 [Ancistrocladus abbreviatus]